MTALALYRGATMLAGPLIRLYLRRRAGRGKEDPARMTERRGIASAPRPAGPLAWLHAASVGEAQSALALVDRLLSIRPDLTVLVTSGTVTSAALLGRRLPERAVHQYVPVDMRGWVRRFLAHWRPDLALFVESELWPNLLSETAASGCPVLLVNGRLSARSFARWRRAPATARVLLGRFALCLGQTRDDASRFAALGAPRTDYLGNLKYSAEPLPADATELAALAKEIGDRPLWLAASTHPGEEELAAAAHAALAPAHPGLLTVVAPRHPDRGDAVETMLRARALTVRRRSAGQRPTADCDIFLADTLGELGLLYRLAPIAFVGGSTTSLGGHNPLEAAQLGCAILYGPDMANFRTVAADLAAAQAAVALDDPGDLAAAVDRLLSRGEERARLARAAAKVSAANADALERIAGAILPFVTALPDAGGTAAKAAEGDTA